MDQGIIVPLAFFICLTFGVTYAIKLLVEARVRIRMLQACESKELIESVVRGEDHRNRMASLRWGILLVTGAIGFAIIQFAGWTTISPGVIAVLLGAFGLGSLLFFWMSRRFG
jgi:hypothetical protein